MMQKFGIDISRWQGDFDIASAVKNYGVEFVIIKAGGSDDGMYIDSRFLDNYIKAKNLEIPVGCYWYSIATSVEQAKAEADYLMSKINGLQFELPLFIDIEDGRQIELSREDLTDVILAWCDRMYVNKWYVGVYSTPNWFTNYMDERIFNYPHWCAFWGASKPDSCGVWQFGGEVNYIKDPKINGQTVDQNYLYVDYENIIKNGGYNGFMVKQFFKDVTAKMSSFKAIQWMASKGWIKGYSDGTFRPDEPLTRAQYCVIEWRKAGRPEV